MRLLRRRISQLAQDDFSLLAMTLALCPTELQSDAVSDTREVDSSNLLVTSFEKIFKSSY
jgi:hypothetical protein